MIVRNAPEDLSPSASMDNNRRMGLSDWVGDWVGDSVPSSVFSKEIGRLYFRKIVNFTRMPTPVGNSYNTNCIRLLCLCQRRVIFSKVLRNIFPWIDVLNKPCYFRYGSDS